MCGIKYLRTEMQPKISIIIPVYNVEKYIAECLESCINQTLKEIEIILVDDCGNDRSMEIVKEYARRDSRIRIIQMAENQKSMLARFEGAKVAKADYIMFLDSDDFLELNTCEIALQEGFDYITFGMFRYCQGKRRKLFIFNHQEFLSLKDYSNWLYRQKYPNLSMVGKLIKKDKFLKAMDSFTKRKISMAEDVMVNFFLICECEKFLNLSDVLYNYRLNMASTSQTNNLKKIKTNYQDLEFVLSTIQNASNKNQKIASLYLTQLKDEQQKTMCKIKSIEGRLSFKDKLERFFFKKSFALRRKIRVKLGL